MSTSLNAQSGKTKNWFVLKISYVQYSHSNTFKSGCVGIFQQSQQFKLRQIETKIFFLKFLKDYQRINDPNQVLETSGTYPSSDFSRWHAREDQSQMITAHYGSAVSLLADTLFLYSPTGWSKRDLIWLIKLQNIQKGYTSCVKMAVSAHFPLLLKRNRVTCFSFLYTDL